MGILKPKCPQCWDSIPCNCEEQKWRDVRTVPTIADFKPVLDEYKSEIVTLSERIRNLEQRQEEKDRRIKELETELEAVNRIRHLNTDAYLKASRERDNAENKLDAVDHSWLDEIPLPGEGR